MHVHMAVLTSAVLAMLVGAGQNTRQRVALGRAHFGVKLRDDAPTSASILLGAQSHTRSHDARSSKRLGLRCCQCRSLVRRAEPGTGGGSPAWNVDTCSPKE